MATVQVLLQGLKPDNDHDSAVNRLLRRADTNEFLFSLAYVRRSGVDAVSAAMEAAADRMTLFLGIRNGITSVQSIFSLLDIGVSPYAVDTGSSGKIFHPKIYAAIADDEADVIVGSANLTFGGLNQNIEASSAIGLDLSSDPDREYLDKLRDTLLALPTTYPDHVFQITDRRQAVGLLHEGRLEDERVSRIPTTTRTGGGRERDRLAPIPSVTGRRRPATRVSQRKVKRRIRSGGLTNSGVLKWESKPLTERSLNIPRADQTNITGDINLGQGLFLGLDFQTYFRNDVFADLTWTTDPPSARSRHERGRINAEIIVKGVSYGAFDLEVTHDPRTDTASFRQRNAMTKIKWGPARSLIARRDLLGRTLRLYKRTDTDFVIVID